MRSSALTKVFSLVIICLVLALIAAGRTSIPPQLIYKYALNSPAKVEELQKRIDMRVGNGGWLNRLTEPPVADLSDMPDLSIVDTGIAMVFAHFGDGAIPDGRFFQTTFIFVNQTRNDSEGTIEFFDDFGDPLVVTIDGVSASSFPFSIRAGQTKRFQTSGTGDIKSGWVHVHSEQPLGGTATFGIRKWNGRIFTDVGVAGSPAGKEFMIFADMVGATQTGLALANPSGKTVEVEIELYTKAGKLKSRRFTTLPPWGHEARFLGQIFSGVGGINEFEGAVILTSDSKFRGITLRSTGDQLTSMPMVMPPAEGVEWTKVAVPHVGDGDGGGLAITTSVVLMNNKGVVTTGTIEFYSSNGEAMMVTIDGVTNSMFNFTLNPNAVARFVTSGTGAIKTGSAVVSMDQPISGTGLFSIYDDTGALSTEVGVATTPLQKNATIVADSLDVFNTGIAVAFPLPADVAAENKVRMVLNDKDGVYKASAEVTLTNFQHDAQFITQLFPDVENIAEFEGRVDITADQYAAILSLRQAGTKLTSMPFFRQRFGFAPASSLEPVQNLTASSPAMLWRLSQNGNDFALESMSLEAPLLGLNAAGLSRGDRIGFGYFAYGTDSRSYELRYREKGSVKFDLIEAGAEGSKVIGEGVLDGGLNRNLRMDLQFLKKKPFTYVGSSITMEFWILPGLINRSLNPPGNVSVTTEFVSVSTKLDEDIRLKRRTTQTLDYQQKDPSLANLTKVSPVFLRPDVVATLEGTNFGQNPLVLFNFELLDSNTYQLSQVEVPVLPTFHPETGWAVTVPVLTSAEPGKGFAALKSIRVDNGAGPGNSYRAHMNFAPIYKFAPSSVTAGATADYTFSFEQAPGQFAVDRFQVGIFGAGASFAGLQVDDIIGTGVYDSTEYNLVVQSVEPAKLVVDVIQEGGSPFGTLTIERFPDATEDEGLPDLGMLYAPVAPPAGPNLLSSYFRMEWSFTGLPIVLPAARSPVQTLGVALSAPTSADPDSGLLTEMSTFHLTQGGSN